MDHNSVEITMPPDNPRYIISLDNIDMSFLQTYKRSTEAPVPLWSVRSNCSDYMEFQVFAEPIPTSTDEEKLENANSRRCHMCEVDVPVAYCAAHKASSKHQVYSALAREGLERINKQMAVELAPVDSLASIASQSSTYFCDSCSLAVNWSDLESHNASKEHTICVKRDKYMDYLLQIYENPSKFEDLLNTCEEFKITLNPKDVPKLEPKLSWKEEVLRCIERVNRATVHKIQYIDDNTIEIRTKSGAKVAVDFDNFHGFCEDASAVLCRVCRSLISDKCKHINDGVHITKIVATIEDKHCVRRLDQILNHCILCNEIIENSEVHISSEKHETALKNSLKDESEEIKKILAENMMHVSNFSKYVYFCNLCKIYVEHNSLEQHVALDYHVELLAKAPRYCNLNKKMKKTPARTEPQKSRSCAMCKVFVQGGKKEMKAHRTTPDHKYLGWLAKKDQEIHHHLKKIDLVNNATCKVCKIIISADKSAMDQHIASVEHQSNFQDLLQKNKMAVVNEKYISCKACEIKVLTFEVLTHINKKNHKKNVTLPPKYPDKEKVAQHYLAINRDEEKVTQDYLVIKRDDYYCEICGVTIVQKDFDVHMNCEWHLEKVAKQEINELDAKKGNQAISLEKNEPQEDTFLDHYEDLRQTVADKTEIDESMDVVTNAHQKQQKDVFDGDYCTVCKVKVKGDESKKKKHVYLSDHRNKLYLDELANGTRIHHHFKVSNDKITCKVCYIGIEANNTSVRNHIESHEHHSRYRALSGNLLTQISKSRVMCSLCDSSFLMLDETSHLTSKGHVRNLRDQGYDLNPVNSGTDNSSSNTSDKNDFIKCGPEYFCGVCSICNLHEKPPANTEDLNARREERIEDHKLPNKASVSKHSAITIDSDDLSDESDSSFATAKTSLTESKSRHECNLVNKEPSSSGDNDLQKIWKLHRTYFMEYQGIDLYCRLCDSEVQSSDIGKHIQNSTHKAKVQAVLQENETTKAVDLTFCGVCNSFTPDNEVEHIFSENHKKNIQIFALPKTEDAKQSVTNSPGHFCGVCNVEVPGSENIQLHNAGKKHQSNIIKLSNSAVPSPINKQLQNDQPVNKISIKESVLCRICKTKYENEPNEKRKHEDSNFHKECDQDPFYLIGKTTDMQYKMELPTADCSNTNNSSVFNFIPGVPMYYWCESNKNDPFYLLSAKADTQNKTEAQNNMTFANISSGSQQVNPNSIPTETRDKKYGGVFSAIPGTKEQLCNICTVRVSNKNQCLDLHLAGVLHKEIAEVFHKIDTNERVCNICNVHMLNTIENMSAHLKSQGHIDSLKAKNDKTTIFNVIPDVPLYYWCESSDKDPFYLLSARSKITNNETVLQDGTEQPTTACSNNQSVFNLIPGAPKSPYNCRISTEIPMYYWCESYDKDPFYLISAMLKNSKIQQVRQGPPATDLQNKCNENMFKIASVQQKIDQDEQKSNENELIAQSQETKDLRHLTNCVTTKAVPTNTDQHLIKSKQILNTVNLTQSSTNNNTTAAPAQLTSQTNAESMCIVNDYCSICSAKVAPSNVREHLRGARHRDNLAFANDAKSVVAAVCTIFKVAVPSGSVENIVQHVQGARHLNNSAVAEKSQTNTNTAESMCILNDYCSVCSAKVAPANVREHLRGPRHRENMAIANDAKSVVADGYCTICKVAVPSGSVENIVQHVQGARHLKNSAVAEKSQTNTNTAESMCIANDYCSVCSAKVAPSNVREHLRGARHRDNLAIANDAKSVVADGYCTICKVAVPSGSVENIVQHVQGARHLKNSAVAEKSQTNTNTAESMCIANDYCSVCSAKVAPSNVREHLRGARHRDNLAIANDAKSVVADGYCTICKVAVPSGSVANIVQHVQGDRHLKNSTVAKTSKTNTNTNSNSEHSTVAKTSKTNTNTNSSSEQTNYIVNSFCTVCQVAVPSGNGVTIHVNGKCHKGNVALVKNNKTSANTSSGSQQLNPVVNGFCTVCKVAVASGNENITIHVNGSHHKGNVAAAQKNKTNANTSSGSKKVNPISIPTETRDTKYGGIFSAIPRTKEQVCNICNVRVSNKIQNLDLHLAGELHKEIAEVFYKTDTDESVCNICNVYMLSTVENMIGHLKSQRHIDSLKAKNTAQTNNDPRDLAAAASPHWGLLKQPPMVYCNICHVKMFDGHTASSHLSSKRHKTTFNNLTARDRQDFLMHWAQQFAVPRGDTPTYIPKASTSHNTTRTNSRESSASRDNNHPTGLYTCQVCNVKVTNGPNNIHEHTQGTKHVNNVIKLNTDSNKPKNDTASNYFVEETEKSPIELNTDSNKPKNDTASNYFEEATEKSPIEIKTSVYTNTQAITEPNINNPSSSTANDITEERPAASAVTTKTDIPDSNNEDSHCGFYICKICNVLVENNQTDIQSHLRSFKHHGNVEKIKESAKEKSESVKTYFCEICKCSLKDNPITIKTHNESISHCQKLDNILTNNKIRVRGYKVCYCALCDLYFNKFSALSHIAQAKHKSLIAEADGTSLNPVDSGVSDSDRTSLNPVDSGVSDSDRTSHNPVDSGVSDSDRTSHNPVDSGVSDSDRTSHNPVDSGVSDSDRTSLNPVDSGVSDSDRTSLNPVDSGVSVS